MAPARTGRQGAIAIALAAVFAEGDLCAKTAKFCTTQKFFAIRYIMDNILVHTTPASSKWWQLWTPKPELEHSKSVVSVPTHATSSNQIGPESHMTNHCIIEKHDVIIDL